ncbi:uncharacterized protein [Antennarius striatus]|uniref:uncharacterized protein n=1 Tax=Antennarius striatus TaxID=241820 RepID=UPI0035AF9119
MMPGQMKISKISRFILLISLLGFTEQFQVKEEEWEELRPDVAALHRLRGLSEHMFHQKLNNPSNQRDTLSHRNRVERSSARVDMDQNPVSLQNDLQDCEAFTACVIQKEKEFENFLALIDKQKIQDWLITASEISHSYSQKLLVIIDYEKSTHDRAQQEYSLDPHYSLLVRKDCLNNVSCLPEANDNTVVKIFGSVSENGQAVSGLSGSSLAELMLKPSLKAAPVFSIDGNTSSHFQYSFIRIFMLHGVKAVLEINQDNHQIYQIMTEPDSVSGYQIPQRPVDHSTQYDHQQILIMEHEATVKTAATYLYDKHPRSSSVYTLDNQKPKLIKGDSVPLTENSRLVLVGHGIRQSSGEMKLSGYTAQEVAEIIKDTFRVGNEIKTISVVACEVGSDKVFVETLLKELHEKAGIKAELHLRDAVIQVRHTGEKITQGISTDGTEWRHKDDSVKVVANLDRNGNVIVRTEPGNRGEAIFTNERNLLYINKKIHKRFQVFRDSWPTEPRRFIDQNVFEQYDQNALNELEALSWGFFHRDLPSPRKVDMNNLQQIDQDYILGEHFRGDTDIRWISDNNRMQEILSKCYEIKSGEDVRSIIRHYAKTGEDGKTFLMVNDWIYAVDPQTLYVYPVGKRLNNNDKNIASRREQIKEVIKSQVGNEHYHKIKQHIIDQNNKTAVKDLEHHSSVSSHQVNYYVENTGKAVGMVGLMLGMKGTVSAFEQGDIKDGLVAKGINIGFKTQEKKADCQQRDPFSKCIKSLRIDYSSSPSALALDLEKDEALSSVSEVRGSDFNDVIRGNKEHNVISPGKGADYIQGRGGEDW